MNLLHDPPGIPGWYAERRAPVSFEGINGTKNLTTTIRFIGLIKLETSSFPESNYRKNENRFRSFSYPLYVYTRASYSSDKTSLFTTYVISSRHSRCIVALSLTPLSNPSHATLHPLLPLSKDENPLHVTQYTCEHMHVLTEIKIG